MFFSLWLRGSGLGRRGARPVRHRRAGASSGRDEGGPGDLPSRGSRGRAPHPVGPENAKAVQAWSMEMRRALPRSLLGTVMLRIPLSSEADTRSPSMSPGRIVRYSNLP